MRANLAKAILAISAASVAVAADARGQAPKPKSAYERLDNIQLAQTLGRMGMIGALEALKAELGKSNDRVGVLVVEAQLHLTEASRPAAPGEAGDRQELIQQAVSKLRHAAEGLQEPEDDGDVVNWLRYLRVRFMLARTLGLDQGGPYAEAILGLLADQKDASTLEEITAEAAYQAELITETVRRKLEDWRDDLRAVLVKVPRINRFRGEIEYDLAWIYLYRGVSLPAKSVTDAAGKKVKEARESQQNRTARLAEALRLLGGEDGSSQNGPVGSLQRARMALKELLASQEQDPERLERLYRRAAGRILEVSRRKDMILATAEQLAEPYAAQGAGESSHWALLLQGIAAREAGRYDQAAGYLNKIRTAASPEGSPAVSNDVLAEAMFHLARTQVERPGPGDAGGLKAIEDYRNTGVKLLPPARHGNVEIRAALLRCYLYDKLVAAAMAANETQRAAALQLDIAGAMFAFQDQYGLALEQIVELIAKGQDVSQLMERRKMLEGLQSTLFGLLARKFEDRLTDEGVHPLFKDAVRLAMAVRDLWPAEDAAPSKTAIEALEKIARGRPPAAADKLMAERIETVNRRVRSTAHYYAGSALFSLQKAGAADQRRRWSLMRDAANHWHAVARDYPKSPLAFSSAQNAAAVLRSLNIALADAGEKVTAEFYREYRKVLATLLGGWGDKPGVESWHPEMGRVGNVLAGDKIGAEALHDKIAAVNSYEKTSPDRKTYMQDRFFALSIRFELFVKQDQWLNSLSQLQDQIRREELTQALRAYSDADYLVKELDKYAADAKAHLDKTEDEKVRESLTAWGAWTALKTAEMLMDKGRRESNLDLKQRAIDKAKEIQRQWKGTTEAAAAEVYEVQWLFETGRPEGVEKLLKVLETQPEEASRLLPGIYRIRDTARDMVKAGVGGKYVQQYELFARLVYDQRKDLADDEPDKYEAIIVYADALFEAGKTKEALAMWKEAKRLDDLRLEKEQKKIDSLADGWHGKAKSPSTSLRVLKEVAKECVETSRSERAVGVAVQQLELYLPSASADGEQQLRKLMVNAASEYRSLSKNRLAVDAEVVKGLARTRYKNDQFAEAMPLYRKLIPALEYGTKDYWTVQQEYCDCWLRTLQNDKEAMRRLVTYIGQIGGQNRAGLKEILAKAKSYSQ